MANLTLPSVSPSPARTRSCRFAVVCRRRAANAVVGVVVLELRARTRRFPGQSSRPRLHPSIAVRRASTRATVAVASSREGRLIVVSIARSTRRAAIDSIRFDSSAARRRRRRRRRRAPQALHRHLFSRSLVARRSSSSSSRTKRVVVRMARHPRHPRPEGRDDARAREKGGASIAANTTLALKKNRRRSTRSDKRRRAAPTPTRRRTATAPNPRRRWRRWR